MRVWISGGDRQTIIVPEDYVATRFGLDYVKVRDVSKTLEVPVQRGQMMTEGFEILSGLKDGDVLVRP